jgi:hypothetical protein
VLALVSPGVLLGIPAHRDRRFRSIVTGHSGAS